MPQSVTRVWLLTWTTYGTWLPGDRRGFGGPVRDKVGRKVLSNEPGAEYFRDLPLLEHYAAGKLKGESTLLTLPQAEAARRQFEATAKHRGWSLLAGAIMANHVHLVVAVDGDPGPETLLRDFKSYASRALSEPWPRVAGRWWTRSGSTRKLPSEAAVETAVRYVLRQRGALVVWSASGEPPASAGGSGSGLSEKNPTAYAVGSPRTVGSPRKPRLGLIGGVGCGKSFVASLFARRGAAVLDADRFGHLALRDPALRAAVVARWGEALLGPDGEIDRKRLGAIVFADPAARKHLEALVFPWIHQRMLEGIRQAEADPAVPLILLDAAVLLESGWNDELDGLIFIDVPEAIRKERVARSRGWPAEELERREAAQLPLEEKRRRATHVIDNGGAAEATETQVAALWAQLGLPEPAPPRAG